MVLPGSVDVSHHGVRNAGCLALAGALRFCPRVRFLGLRDCLVNARGALALAEELSALEQLMRADTQHKVGVCARSLSS
jgi:hypothetical protein